MKIQAKIHKAFNRNDTQELFKTIRENYNIDKLNEYVTNLMNKLLDLEEEVVLSDELIQFMLIELYSIINENHPDYETLSRAVKIVTEAINEFENSDTQLVLLNDIKK